MAMERPVGMMSRKITAEEWVIKRNEKPLEE
jgi:hypothetical protein